MLVQSTQCIDKLISVIPASCLQAVCVTRVSTSVPNIYIDNVRVLTITGYANSTLQT